jgi:hypothetical protein
MNRFSNLLFVTLIAGAGAVQAQNPLSAELKQSYTGVKTNLIKMAEKMPDDAYSFKPVPEVETFGKRIAHIADANVGGCARVKGEQKTVGAASKTSKADLVAALKESFAYCDGVIDSLTDADAVQMISVGRGGNRSKLAVLYGMVAHSNELYGYMSVYMRVKGIVPPSSEGAMR